jgi:nitroreductase
MTLIDVIKSRRSIRRFTGEVINEEILKSVLEAGFQAPSAHNLHPQHFIVIRDQESLEAIASKHKYAKMLPKSGCGIVVCGDRNKQSKEGLLVADCSAAIQNMLLVAHSIDLGAVWIGIHPIDGFEQMIRDTIDLPDHILPVGMIAIGYRDENKEMIDRFDESRIHLESW